MRYYTTVELGRKQRLTPEGFLVCEDVPIARTGVMLYAGGEVPVTPGKDGLVRIERGADEVFSERTIASFEGKAVTVDHPSEDVSPDNWQELAHGIVQNVRRGTGIEDDFLIADFVLTKPEAIKLVRDNKLREVSCGYDADYEEIEPGSGRQTNIVGNHVALVENGRCGSRCAIGDSMKKLKFIDRLRAAFKARDEDEHEKVLTEAAKDSEAEAEETDEEKKKREAEEGKTEDGLSKVLDAINGLTQRVADLETKVTDKKAKDEEEEEEAPKKDDEADGKTEDDAEGEESDDDEEKEKKAKANDSASLVAEQQDTVARAEILAPGLHLPTLDSADPVKFRDALCGLRRKALTAAFAADATRDAVAPLVAGKDIKALTCDAVSAMFVGASEIVRRANNASQTTVTFDASKHASRVASSISNINRRNAEFWARS